ncbi:Hypothetical protein R9X50_00524100 [Acrodontium crateriforme]|uniref:Vacuolar protein sorting-associated protein 8 central domain-containing protein n=1 Tax=Acrodontium crateriforme TaxID=150365 RepID=A0AAQ3M8Z5_9PEZI|nr:Hypothetical protein R9X50_00524100 [Acrodontium crateriforme]
MSSISGGSNADVDNEDVEAEESTVLHTSNSREEVTEHDKDNDTEYGAVIEQPQKDDGSQEDGDLPYGDFQDAEDLDEQDYAQLDRENVSLADDTEPGGIDFGVRTPIASPGGSSSIPDDTPSLRGSLLSSASQVASPTPGARKATLRTASGTPQPFERRFETRLTGSPSPSPRAHSPAFLSAHSRQISLSSQISQVSSQDGNASEDSHQAPWDIVRWIKLRKITGQAFSEIGRRNFGRPTCMAVSALIAIGTTKGLILGFDYHQTLKIIIGQGTKATECGSVTAIAIAADYSTIASGHANGHIFTWEINRPARPFLQIPPLDHSPLQSSDHFDGHVSGCAILHIGFLGTRHTALVSADAGGMAFSHLATRGLGPVTRAVKTTRLLGRYPSADKHAPRSKKPSSVLAFSPLPLGNVEQGTDEMGLTALLTPYLLVIVSTTPVARTQFKFPRPKEIQPHGTLSGALAWFPAVKLKHFATDAKKTTSETKLAFCWSNLLTVIDVKVLANDDPAKSPSLEFEPRSRWRADEAIVAIQWLGRSILGVLTISQRLLIVEDGSLQVTDSIDLLHKRIYHQDLFSDQLRSVVENLESDEPALHGVVADAFYMSFRAYKGRMFLLSFDDLAVGSLSNWADRLLALMEAGDHIAAIRLATEYYSGGANNVTVGLSNVDSSRHEMVRERLVAMITASLNYTFSQHDDDRQARLRELTDVSTEACLIMEEPEYLFSSVFELFEEADEEAIFIAALEPYILDGQVKTLPPDLIKTMVSYFISENQSARLEELLCRLDPKSFDLDQITMLCRQHSLYDALIHVWTRAIGDYVTPLIDILSLIKLLKQGDEDENLADHPFFESGMKVFPFLAYSLTGREYPSGEYMDDDKALEARVELYEYLFSGKAIAWPQGSSKIFLTTESLAEEPAFPYLLLLFQFDCPSLISMLNEAFEDPFLNETDDETGVNGHHRVNGITTKPGYKMTRQHIISIMLDVMRQNEFLSEQIAYLDMFIARSLPKYPGQLVLSGSLLSEILQRLCHPPCEAMRDDCQLSVEYLLSGYHPPEMGVIIKSLKDAKFFRVLKNVYRGEKMLTELLETYFEDTDDKTGVFDCITHCLRVASTSNQNQLAAVKQKILAHIQDIADINTIRTASVLVSSARDLLKPSVEALEDSYQQLIFLRTLLEPSLIRDEFGSQASPSLSTQEQSIFTEKYVQLMCAHDPKHVADYVGTLPTSHLRLEIVLPAMEKSGVVDAAVVLLARDGLARDAMERLITHLQSLQRALSGLISTAMESPDLESTREAGEQITEDIEKYVKVGVWLCQGQSAPAQRRPRPRTNFAWDVKEDDLDPDEYLWLNLVDAVVQVSKDTTESIRIFDRLPSELDSKSVGFEVVATSLRSSVQQVFTALLAATSSPTAKTGAKQPHQAKQAKDNLSFLRVLRAFLTRAATTSPSLSELRAVLSDIFAAYAFEQDVLLLANDLLGSDVFTEIDEANQLRQRGWRPRSQICEHCKRRAWGPGIGQQVWDEWVAREQIRESDKAKKLVERVGGEEARRLERGKGKASTSATVETSEVGKEDVKKFALVVFACRHVFHRVCLDQDYKDGKPVTEGTYKCPLCTEHV